MVKHEAHHDLDELAQQVRAAGKGVNRDPSQTQPDNQSTETGATEQPATTQINKPPMPAYPTPPTRKTPFEAASMVDVNEPHDTPDTAEALESTPDDAEALEATGLVRNHKVLATITALAILGAGIGGGVAINKLRPHHAAEQSTDVGGAPHPTASIIPNNPTPTSTETVPNQEDLVYPNFISGSAVQPGNINLTEVSSWVGAAPMPYKYDVTWQGQTIELPMIFAPGSLDDDHEVTIQDTANMILANFAALMTLDPNSDAFNTVMNNFTEDSIVKQWILSSNQEVKNVRRNDAAPNQLILFDEASDPITFSLNSNDNNWYASDSINARLLNRNCEFATPDATTCQIASGSVPASMAPKWQDSRAFIPGQSMLLRLFDFRFSANSDGTASVSNIGGSFWNGSEYINQLSQN